MAVFSARNWTKNLWAHTLIDKRKTVKPNIVQLRHKHVTIIRKVGSWVFDVVSYTMPLLCLLFFNFPRWNSRGERKTHLHEVDLIQLVIYSLSLSLPLFYFISSISNQGNVFCSRPLTWNWEHAIQLLALFSSLTPEKDDQTAHQNKWTRKFRLCLTNGILYVRSRIHASWDCFYQTWMVQIIQP
jgi:hypothetical protein